VSLPYTASGGQANNWGVWLLDQTGALTDTGARFAMGRATGGVVAFTPDGQVAIAPQSDGTLGVVRFDGSTPVVVPRPLRRFVLRRRGRDRARRRLGDRRRRRELARQRRAACTGSTSAVTARSPIAAAGCRPSWPAALHVVGDRAVLAATEVGATPAGHDLHLLDWTPRSAGGGRRGRRLRRRRRDRRRRRGSPPTVGSRCSATPASSRACPTASRWSGSPGRQPDRAPGPDPDRRSLRDRGLAVHRHPR
jgi:hypothetical protein